MEIQIRALRAQMQELDTRLADLFDARMTLFAQIAVLKHESGLSQDDTDFEQETIRLLSAKLHGPSAAYLPLFFEHLFDLGHDYQAYILEDD